MRGLNRLRADRGQVGAQFLAGLGAFNQRAPRLAGKPAVAAQFAHSVEQAGGALDAFQRDGSTSDRNCCLADIERDSLRRTLLRHGGTRPRAAAVLGISERSIYRLIKQYELGE